tara:strand:- start:240 stop:665 length:426 start_codon:yes stop_codon:yes gene_type:complete
MRLSNLNLGALPLFDRAPATIQEYYAGATVAPAGFTVRWTYTVPASKLALINQANILLLRDGVASPVGRTELGIEWPTGGTYPKLLFVTSLDNVVGDSHQQAIGQAGFMVAAQAVRGYTSDPSTGGTNFFILSATFTEFDI